MHTECSASAASALTQSRTQHQGMVLPTFKLRLLHQLKPQRQIPSDPQVNLDNPSLVILQCRESTNMVQKMVLLSETWNHQSHLQTLSDALEKGAPLLILFAFYYGVVFASTPAKCDTKGQRQWLSRQRGM